MQEGGRIESVQVRTGRGDRNLEFLLRKHFMDGS